jgi:hypothetical protein
MKYQSDNRAFGMIWVKVGLILLASIILALVTGCRSTKTQTTSTSSSSDVNNRYIDSVRVSDSTRITKRLEERTKELATDVSFHQSNEIELINALNELQDSLNAKGQLTDDQQRRIKKILDSIAARPCRNEVVVNRDGSVRFIGQIKDLNIKLSESYRLLDSMAKANRDSLAKSDSSINEKKEEHTIVTTKVKRGWPFWVWLAIGYALGAISILLISKKNKTS